MKLSVLLADVVSFHILKGMTTKCGWTSYYTILQLGFAYFPVFHRTGKWEAKNMEILVLVSDLLSYSKTLKEHSRENQRRL